MRLVPIECVKEGTFLAKTIFDNNGRILLREGIKLNNNFIKRIRQIGIYSLYINDEYSSVEIEDIIKPQLRQKSIKTLKDTFAPLEKSTTSPYGNALNKKDDIKKRAEYFSSIENIASEIIDELTSRKNIMINLVDIKSMDNYTYQHSVNVAVLSMVLGMHLQLNKFDLYKLCIGALLHDIGKVFIPEEILKKQGSLSDEEFVNVKGHPSKGYDYLKGSIDLSPSSRVIVLQHHEKVDGTGYPEGRKGDDINKLAKIVSIADVYDALTSDRPYRRALSPNEAVEYILGSGGSLFDYKMVVAFAECITPYPEGTIVKLSSGDLAIVEEIHPHFSLRPTVKIIKSNNPASISKTFNLMEQLDLVINGVAYSVD